MVGTRLPSSPSSPPPSQLLSSLTSDPALHVFLSPTFSPPAHVGAAVRSDAVAPALDAANRASALLTAAVRHEVIRRKDALLAEVEAVHALEREVSTVSAGVAALTTATAALSDALQTPFGPMRAAVARMTNLHAAARLLRALGRFRHCTARLADAALFPTLRPAAATPPHTLPPAAAALRELEDLVAPAAAHGLDKVEGVSRELLAVRRAAPELRKRAAALLRAGLAGRVQTDVEAAVGAFAELGVVQERVNGEMARLLRETQAIVHRGLDAPAGAAVGRGAPVEGGDVWARTEGMLDGVAEACFTAILLQHVLSSKYCDVTHMSLLHEPVASAFVDAVARTLAEQVGILSRTRLQRPAAAQVFLALAEGFPRLKGLLMRLTRRVIALARVLPIPITRVVGTAKLPLIPDDEFIRRAFLGAVVEVETHYLTASLERLTAMVSSFFKDGKHAGESEALMLTKALAAELSATRSDEQLFRTAISNVATALRLYTSHAEDYAAATAPDEDASGKALGEVEDWRLTRLYNGMVTLSQSATRVLGESDDGSGPIPPPIAKELATLTHLSDLLLGGPFSTCRRNVDAVLRRMHTENLAGEAGEDGCSVYVLDIHAQLSMFADGIIPGLARSRSLGRCTLQLAEGVLEAFVRHVALVFPQSQAATMRLSTDMARIELGVESLCPARLLGASFRRLRALRAAVLMPTAAFVEVGGDKGGAVMEQVAALDRVTVAHLMLGRSRDDCLVHPHRRKGQAAHEYVAWLDGHSQEEAWSEVEASLQAYEEQRGTEDGPWLAEYQAIRAFCSKL